MHLASRVQGIGQRVQPLATRMAWLVGAENMIRFGDIVCAYTPTGTRHRIGRVISRSRDPEARARSRKEGERVVHVALHNLGHLAWYAVSELSKV